MKTKLLITGLVCAFFLTACEDASENYPPETGSYVSESASGNIDTAAQSSVTESAVLTEGASISAETAQTAAVTKSTAVTESISEAAAENGNTLFEDILPHMDKLSFFTLEDGLIRFAETSNKETAQEVFDFVSNVPAKKAEDWSAGVMTSPVYGFYAYGDDNSIIFSAAWSNGFLVASDGTAYRFDCDLSTVETGYDWDGYGYYGNGYVSDMPCGYFFSFDENGWIKENLSKRLPFDPANAPEGVTVEYIGYDDNGATVRITNELETDFTFFGHFQVEVLLDGEWYVVPVMDGNWVFTRIKIPTSSSGEFTYPLDKYGNLPAGSYCIVEDEFYVEFTI